MELLSDSQLAELRRHIGAVYEGALVGESYAEAGFGDFFTFDFSSGQLGIGGEDAWLDDLDVEYLEFFQFRVNPNWTSTHQQCLKVSEFAGQRLKDVKLVETTLKGTTPIVEGWSLTLDTGIVFELETGFITVSATALNPPFMNLFFAEHVDIDHGPEFASLREAFNYSRDDQSDEDPYFDYTATTKVITLDEAGKREPRVSI